MKPNTVMLGFYDNILPEDMLKNTLFRKKRRLLNYGLTSSTSNGTLSQNGSVYQFDGTCFWLYIYIYILKKKNRIFSIQTLKAFFLFSN
jgi:hypothetical protein